MVLFFTAFKCTITRSINLQLQRSLNRLTFIILVVRMHLTMAPGWWKIDPITPNKVTHFTDCTFTCHDLANLQYKHKPVDNEVPIAATVDDLFVYLTSDFIEFVSSDEIFWIASKWPLIAGWVSWSAVLVTYQQSQDWHCQLQYGPSSLGPCLVFDCIL